VTPAHRRYLRVEMAIAAVINAVLSVAFVFLVFGGGTDVPVAGSGGLIVDALPQSAMIALMSTLVPTLLTRRRMRAASILSRKGRVWRPHNVAVRALAVALAVAVVAGLAHAALLPLGPPWWPFAAVLAYKTGYGALLGMAIARWAVIAALADPVVPVRGDSAAATDRRGA
jgi:hypothetical protein